MLSKSIGHKYGVSEAVKWSTQDLRKFELSTFYLVWYSLYCFEIHLSLKCQGVRILPFPSR